MIRLIRNTIFMLGILLTTLLAKEAFIQLPMDIAETTFNEDIPLPKEIFGHSIGEQHTRTDQIIDYFEAVAATSGRVIIKEHGRTHEGRRLIHAIVTSADNQKKLDEIQANNKKLSSDPKKVSNKKIKKMPVIAYFGYSIHGDESSGGEAAMLLLYHLSAGSSIAIRNYLENIVLIIDPMLNPDECKSLLYTASYYTNVIYTPYKQY